MELYAEARYFTMTGAHLSLAHTAITEGTDALAAIHADVVADESAATDGEASHGPGESPQEAMATSTESSRGDGNGSEPAGDPATLSDAELIERAQAAANGAKFQRLWCGGTAGYPSYSEADMALCCLLAFWTGGDAQRMDPLVRESSLIRPKWDEVHYADGRTYGEVTIERACCVTSDRYDPNSADIADQRRQSSASPGEAGGDSAEYDVASAGTTAASEPPADASVAHLREANAVLRERVREQQAQIAALEAQLADGSAAVEGTTHDGAADAQSPSVVRRLRGVFAR